MLLTKFHILFAVFYMLLTVYNIFGQLVLFQMCFINQMFLLCLVAWTVPCNLKQLWFLSSLETMMMP